MKPVCNKIALNKEAICDDFFILSKGLAGEFYKNSSIMELNLRFMAIFPNIPASHYKISSTKVIMGKDVFFVSTENEVINRLS